LTKLHQPLWSVGYQIILLGKRDASSSSDRVDSGGPLRQPGMPTTGRLGPFSAMSKGVPSPICCIYE